MKKILLGTAIGLGLGYLARRMQEEGYFEKVCDSFSSCASKSKRNIKNYADIAQNEAEYIGERAGKAVQKGKEKLGSIVDKEK